MKWLRLFARVFGWLLTPFLAWAASFFGAVAGSIIASQVADPVHGLLLTALCGGIAGFAAILAWLRLLRSSPEIRDALAVTADGTPDTVAMTSELHAEQEPPVTTEARS
jgi:hypothetical protein